MVTLVTDEALSQLACCDLTSELLRDWGAGGGLLTSTCKVCSRTGIDKSSMDSRLDAPPSGEVRGQIYSCVESPVIETCFVHWELQGFVLEW